MFGGRRLGTGVLFLLHSLDSRVRSRIEALRSTLAPSYHLYVYVDVSGSDADSLKDFQAHVEARNVSVVSFRFDDLHRVLGVPVYDELSIAPGSVHLPLVALSLSTRHRFYWGVEWDVLFTGAWSEFFSSFENPQPDFVASFFCSYEEEPDWHYWAGVHFPVAEGGQLAATNLRKAFLPVWGASPKTLKLILDHQRRGWKAHTEVLVPTIAHRCGLKVIDLGTTRFVARNSLPETHNERSSYRWRPEVTASEIRRAQPMTLFHPVKNLDLSFNGNDPRNGSR